MSREPLYAIVYTGNRLELVPAAEAPRRVALLKRQHAEDVLAKYQADQTHDFGRERGAA